MKKILLSFALISSSLWSVSQCNPEDHNWNGAAFGVSPDPSVGENFEPGVINEPYNDQIYVKAPNQISDIPGAPELPIAIDSLTLDYIRYTLGDQEFDISTLGLTVTCNNNGISPFPCHFYPGGSYCGDITGTPTVAGTFPVKIYVTGYFNFLGPQSAEYTFEDYSLTISDGTVSIKETANLPLEMSLGNAQPNPANTQTMIPFDLTQNGAVNFSIYNMMGELVERRTINGKKGNNTFMFDTSALRPGIYLYTLQNGDRKVTKKLMIQH